MEVQNPLKHYFDRYFVKVASFIPWPIIPTIATAKVVHSHEEYHIRLIWSIGLYGLSGSREAEAPRTALGLYVITLEYLTYKNTALSLPDKINATVLSLTTLSTS